MGEEELDSWHDTQPVTYIDSLKAAILLEWMNGLVLINPLVMV